MSVIITRFNPNLKYDGYNHFDCNHHAINKFVNKSLKKQVKDGFSVAYIILDNANINSPGKFIGFFTISNHSISPTSLGPLQLGSMPKLIPCLRLIMLGVDKNYAKQGYGKSLMNHAFDIAKKSAENIGCYGLYLDADPGAINFYLNLGFILLEGDKSPSPSPMFISILSI